jgi:drug/metabolite transporter (DMT)-like permease
MSRRGAFVFAAMCVIWGIPYLLIKAAVDEISPATLVLGRTTIAALVLAGSVLATRRGAPPVGHGDAVAPTYPGSDSIAG